MLHHLYEMTTPPILLNPSILHAVSAVLLQSIAKDTADIKPVDHTPALMVPGDENYLGQGSPTSTVPVQPPPLPASPLFPLPPPEKSRRRGLYIALIACIIILLVGMGIGTVSLFASFSQKSATATPNPSDTVVGHIVFISSQGTFDQVQIDLQNIP